MSKPKTKPGPKPKTNLKDFTAAAKRLGSLAETARHFGFTRQRAWQLAKQAGLIVESRVISQ